MLEIKKALNAWGRYGQLKFTEVNDPRKSDINFGFYRGDHGDSFPFDGIGQVLAHAFFPSNSDPLRGDVHFDADEDWKINPGEFEDAVDFSTVVLHELGHSLGLSHSPEPNSIMNPYYKGKGFELGYDDILAMYELYASRDIPMEEPKLPPYDDRPYWPPYYPTHERWPPAGPSAVPPTERTTTSRPYYPTVSTTAKTTTRHYPKKSHNDGERRREDVPSKDQPRQSNKDIACQNPNNGIDSAAFLRGELFITKGEWLWRLTEAGKVEKGYPVKFHTFFHKLPESVKVIDALYERHDSSIVFFYGRKYWIFDGYNFIENSPRSIEEYGLREMDEIVDAAFYSPKESLTYIFSGDKYWKYNETSKTVVTGYPRYISHHIKGSPSHLNAALINRNGVVYLFKGDTYWIFDTVEKTAKKMGSVFHHWLSC
ncbi:hypothetical protein O3M35_013164 [Rhynocoris fuscipes]|uniref:Peptidase metallopeptidase domain-containing protein n=1 Tax=Rhynocoris fuscipes TaxID=488301 RepID=A0AAW1CK18_9HEMI